MNTRHWRTTDQFSATNWRIAAATLRKFGEVRRRRAVMFEWVGIVVNSIIMWF
jgi:hypothetical protein